MVQDYPSILYILANPPNPTPFLHLALICRKLSSPTLFARSRLRSSRHRNQLDSLPHVDAIVVLGPRCWFYWRHERVEHWKWEYRRWTEEDYFESIPFPLR